MGDKLIKWCNHNACRICDKAQRPSEFKSQPSGRLTCSTPELGPRCTISTSPRNQKKESDHTCEACPVVLKPGTAARCSKCRHRFTVHCQPREAFPEGLIPPCRKSAWVTHLLRNVLSNYWCGMHRTCQDNSVKPNRSDLKPYLPSPPPPHPHGMGPIYWPHMRSSPSPPLWCGGGVALSPSPPVVWWGCGMVCWVCMVCMVGLVWHVWKVWYVW